MALSQAFRVKPWRSHHRFEKYQEYMSVEREDDDPIQDPIVSSVLLRNGYTWAKNTSSAFNVSKWYDKLEAYSPENKVKVDLSTPNAQKAVRITRKWFGKPKDMGYLKVPETPEEIWYHLKGEKSAGLPTLGKKHDDFWYALNREFQVRNAIKEPMPCIAYKRTQLGGKMRLVWGYPHEMTIMEARFAPVVMQALMQRFTPWAAGQSKAMLGARICTIENYYGQVYGLDASGFDSSIMPELIIAAFDIIKTWFHPEHLKMFGWDIIVRYFIHTPIVMPNGKRYDGKCFGVPSGSFFTQLIDSIVNVIVNIAVSLDLGYSLTRDKFMVLGDDIIITIPLEISMLDLTLAFKKYNITLNADKSQRYAHFLGARWHTGIPDRDVGEILQKMAYPESFRLYPSKEKYERYWLAVQLIMQYASSYRNGYNIVNHITNQSNLIMQTEWLPSGIEGYTNISWSKEQEAAALEWVRAFDEGRVLDPDPDRPLSSRIWD